MVITCEFCGGAMLWTLDNEGQVWTRCESDSCESLGQLEMYPDGEPDCGWWVPPGTKGDEPDYHRLVKPQ